MATITASDVKKLRDQTGAGMMDCKAALEEAERKLRGSHDDPAQERAGERRQEGRTRHDRRPHRALVSADRSKGILVEVNCESDFVARTDDFQELVQDVLAAIDSAGDAATESWLKDPNGPVHLRVAAGIGKLGENMAVPRFVRYAGDGMSASTFTWAARSACRSSSAASRPALTAREEFTTLVKEIAMQIAAASPAYVSRSAVPAEILEKERAIYRAQMESSGKPATRDRQDRRRQARQLLLSRSCCPTRRRSAIRR